MKALHALAATVLALVLLAAGGYAAWSAFVEPSRWADVAGALQFLAANRLSCGSAALASVLFVLIWMLSSVPRRERAQFLTFENPGGEVRVSLDAIRDYVARLSGEFGEIVSMRPAVSTRRDQLRVNVECRVRSGTQIPVFTRAFQERVRESLQTDLGLTDLPAIGVTVRQIVGGATAPRPRGPAAAPAEGDAGGDTPGVA